jgi:hypothetical protein
MDSITPIVNEYWLNQAKLFIQQKLVLGNGLNDTVKDNLAILYNQITSENGAESFEKAKQIITEMHKIRGIEIDKQIRNITAGLLIVAFLIAVPGDKFFGRKALFRTYIAPFASISLLGAFVGLFVYGASVLNIQC